MKTSEKASFLKICTDEEYYKIMRMNENGLERIFR